MNFARQLATKLKVSYETTTDLEQSKFQFPLVTGNCRECADPCDEAHEEYPKSFKIDLSSQLLGTVKPYQRQVLISTGQSDWAHEVTDVSGSLAAYLQDAHRRLSKPNKEDISTHPSEEAKTPPGIFTSSSMTRLSILNGNHQTNSYGNYLSTVLIFPDYIAIRDLENSSSSAEKLWKSALDPALPRFGLQDSELKSETYILPYACVILLCSHKKRDKRCHIAAPKLESTFTQVLNAEGWEVDFQPRDLTVTSGEMPANSEISLERLKSMVQEAGNVKKALIIKTSHVGGHKYAGNVIIYMPHGSGVWYGRVTPHHVAAIVKQTIVQGKILKDILRGGLNISRGDCKSFIDW